MCQAEKYNRPNYTLQDVSQNALDIYFNACSRTASCKGNKCLLDKSQREESQQCEESNSLKALYASPDFVNWKGVSNTGIKPQKYLDDPIINHGAIPNTPSKSLLASFGDNNEISVPLSIKNDNINNTHVDADNNNNIYNIYSERKKFIPYNNSNIMAQNKPIDCGTSFVDNMDDDANVLGNYEQRRLAVAAMNRVGQVIPPDPVPPLGLAADMPPMYESRGTPYSMNLGSSPKLSLTSAPNCGALNTYAQNVRSNYGPYRFYEVNSYMGPYQQGCEQEDKNAIRDYYIPSKNSTSLFMTQETPDSSPFDFNSFNRLVLVDSLKKPLVPLAVYDASLSQNRMKRRCTRKEKIILGVSVAAVTAAVILLGVSFLSKDKTKVME